MNDRPTLETMKFRLKVVDHEVDQVYVDDAYLKVKENLRDVDLHLQIDSSSFTIIDLTAEQLTGMGM